MSYSIMYDAQFIRSNSGITPVVLMGDNNVSEQHWNGSRFIWRRSRDWNCFMNLLGASEQEVLDSVEKLTGGQYQEHWMRGNKWVDDEGARRWAKNGIKNAASLEEILDINGRKSAQVCISVWRGCNHTYEKNEYITNTSDLDLWIREAKDLIAAVKKNKANSAFPIIKFWEGMNHPVRHSNSEKFVLKAGNAYLSAAGSDYAKWDYGIEKAMVLSYDEAITLAGKWLLHKKKMRIMPAKAKAAPKEEAVIVVRSSGAPMYVYKLSKNHFLVTQQYESAHKYASVKTARATANRLAERLKDKGYTFDVAVAGDKTLAD